MCHDRSGVALEGSGDKENAEIAYDSGIQIHRYYAECHYYMARINKFRGPGRKACAAYLQYNPRGARADECRRRAKLK